jgi:hypothetical protein
MQGLNKLNKFEVLNVLPNSSTASFTNLGPGGGSRYPLCYALRRAPASAGLAYKFERRPPFPCTRARVHHPTPIF